MGLFDNYTTKMNYEERTRRDSQKRYLQRAVNSLYDNITLNDVQISDKNGNIRNQEINIYQKRSAKTTRAVEHSQRFFISLVGIFAGEKLLYQNQWWLVLTSNNDKEAYYEGTIIRCNAKVKWSYTVWNETYKQEETKVEEEYIASYDNNRLEGAEYFDWVTLPNTNRRIYAPNNTKTATLQRAKSKFVLDGALVQVIKIDNISLPGVKLIIADEIQTTPTEMSPIEIPVQPNETSTELYVSGSSKIVYSAPEEYVLLNSTTPPLWSVVQNSKLVELSVVDDKAILTLKNLPKIIGEEIILQAESGGEIVNKIIIVRSVL